MASSNFSQLAVSCQNCGAQNIITTNHVADDQQINCSKCHTPMGPWRDVRKQSNENHAP